MKTKTIDLLLILAALFAVAGWLESEPQLVELEIYCENVREGLWPDYNNIYIKECKNARQVVRT